MPIRILLADDHTLFRLGLKRVLDEYPEFQVVAEADTGIKAVDLAREHRPDIAIVDIGMKELNGVECTAQLLRQSPETAVLILSMHSDERYVLRAVKAGARGYLLKDSVEEGLVRALHLLHEGQAYFSPAVAKVLQANSDRALPDWDDSYESLTERERQLYQLLAEGLSNKEIANRLNLSINTVTTHRARIMEKLEVRSIAELVLSAVRRGLVT
ncbi:MAG: response regulator transcription factor [Bryobacteraceae bacterium]|nr:response regulator transcription factor [Bryobacteraceae bacterium]